MKNKYILIILLVAYYVGWCVIAKQVEAEVADDIAKWNALGYGRLEYQSLAASGYPLPNSVKMQGVTLFTEIRGTPIVVRLNGQVHATREWADLTGQITVNVSSEVPTTLHLGAEQHIYVSRTADRLGWDFSATCVRDGRDSYFPFQVDSSRDSFPACEEIQTITGNIHRDTLHNWTLDLKRTLRSSGEEYGTSSDDDTLHAELGHNQQLSLAFSTTGEVLYTDAWRQHWADYLSGLWQVLPHSLLDAGDETRNVALCLIPKDGIYWKAMINADFDLTTNALKMSLANGYFEHSALSLEFNGDVALPLADPSLATASGKLTVDGTDYRDLVDNTFSLAQDVLKRYLRGIPEEKQGSVALIAFGLRAFREPSKELLLLLADDPEAPSECMSYSFSYRGGTGSPDVHIGKHSPREISDLLMDLALRPKEDPKDVALE